MAERFEIVEKALLTLLNGKKYSALKDILVTMNPSDIAAVFDDLEESRIPVMYRLLPKELAAETFVEMEADAQELLIRGFSDNELKEVLDELYVDDAADLVDGLAHFRVCLAENSPHHIGRHFLNDVNGIVNIQFIQHFLQLVVGKAPDQKLLILRFHLNEGLRCQLLGKQAEHQRDPLIIQRAKNTCNIRRVYGHKYITERGILLILDHFEDRFFYKFKTLGHPVLPPHFQMKHRGQKSARP